MENSLIYGLAGLKNVGLEAMEALVKVRNKKIFVNLFDFSRRLDLRKIGKRPLEMLVQAGAFDVLDTNRHRIFKSLDALVAYSAAIHDQKTQSKFLCLEKRETICLNLCYLQFLTGYRPSVCRVSFQP